MKLTQLFSGEVHTENTGHPQPTPAQAEQMNRQIRSLVPGQTISGEIVSRNGSEVQIKLSEDMYLNARVDRNINLDVGKNMTFEVKNNGRALTLSPLFTNVSTDVNVLKALDMAGLPVNKNSIGMTEQLMAAGLSVNRNFLQQVYREINSFPQGQIADIINLHRLQMPVNEANMGQMEAYRNLSHQLVGGMDEILQALPEVFDSMVAEGDVYGAVKLFGEVLGLIEEAGGQELPVPENLPSQEAVESMQEKLLQGVPDENAQKQQLQGVPGETIQGQQTPEAPETVQGQQPQNMLSEGMLKDGGLLTGMPLEELPENNVQNAHMHPAYMQKTAHMQDAGHTQGTGNTQGLLPEASKQGAAIGLLHQDDKAVQQVLTDKIAPNREENFSAQSNTELIPETLRAAVADEILEMLDDMQLPAQEDSVIRGQVMQFAQGYDVQQLFTALSNLTEAGRTSLEFTRALEKLFSGRDFRALMTGQLKNLWTVKPEELFSPKKVEELYRRLDRQLRNLTEALENAGQSNTAASKAASSMTQNIDFLQQINQMYTYVQLPLRMQQGEAHGELYVYTNKKKLSSRDGTISALLHLDMDNLGPVDVYVAMQSSKVSTKFYLQDEEMIDFMGAHMDLLTERLKKRGYDCSYAMVRREDNPQEATAGGLEPILRQEKGIALTQYAFDVRT